MIKIKDTKAEIPFLLSLGIVLFAAALIALLLVYRPFVPWKKFVCSADNGTLIDLNCEGGGWYRKFIYEIDNVQYEKTLKIYSGKNVARLNRTIYVNKNNPHDVKAGGYGAIEFLVMLILFMSVGVYLIFCATKLIISKCKHKKNKKKQCR